MANELFPIGKEKYGLKTVREAYDLIVEKFGRDDNSWPEKKGRQEIIQEKEFHNIPSTFLNGYFFPYNL